MSEKAAFLSVSLYSCAHSLYPYNQHDIEMNETECIKVRKEKKNRYTKAKWVTIGSRAQFHSATTTNANDNQNTENTFFCPFRKYKPMWWHLITIYRYFNKKFFSVLCVCVWVCFFGVDFVFVFFVGRCSLLQKWFIIAAIFVEFILGHGIR